MLRAGAVRRPHPGDPMPYDLVVLRYEARFLRRGVLTTAHDEKVLVDLPRAAALVQRDRLVLEDGRHVEVIAGEDDLYDVRAADGFHLVRLAWHLGNRHVAAQIEPDRILILRDAVLRDMLVGLGAVVAEISAPFAPEGGAYDAAADLHGHAHGTADHVHAHPPGSHAHAAEHASHAHAHGKGRGHG